MQTIIDSALKGQDFSKLAKIFSECESRKNGGDLGYLEPGYMSKDFEEAAFALQPGELS